MMIDDITKKNFARINELSEEEYIKFMINLSMYSSELYGLAEYMRRPLNINDVTKGIRSMDMQTYKLLQYHILDEIYGENIDDIRIKDRILAENDETRKSEYHYYYIPAHMERFCHYLKAYKQNFNCRGSFIDVGCGIGDKVLLAHLSGLFDDVYGIEYSEYTVGIAKEKISPIIGKDCFVHENAFKHDFSPYDVIYLYIPIKDINVRIKLYRHIAKCLNSLSIIIPLGEDVISLHKKVNFPSSLSVLPVGHESLGRTFFLIKE